MGNKDKSGGDVALVASLLLLTVVIGMSFGGFMMVSQWRETQRRAEVSHNLKQLRLSIQQYRSSPVVNPVSEE